MEYTNFGSGPGIQSPDGCSVELYRQLPYLGELEEIIPEFEGQSSVLELGCGTGRLASRLAELGLSVTGVDESHEMLSLLPEEIEGVCSSIETLHLDRHWPVVLLPSHLINHPASAVRNSLLKAGYRHTASGGYFYVQRHRPEWLEYAETGKIGESAGVSIFVDAITQEWPLVTMTLRYQMGDAVWKHHFTAQALSEDDIEVLLRRVGFSGVEWCGSSRLWARAKP